MNSPAQELLERGDAETSVVRAFRDLTARFRVNALATPELDARILVCEACGLTHEQFAAAPERPVTRAEQRHIDVMASRRLGGEPVSRILGTREFCGLDFMLAPGTLDPRPDTETVVDITVDRTREMAASLGPPRILDLGTGTGCILISVLRACPEATGLGLDIDAGAVAAARANAVRHGVADRVRFVHGSWLELRECSAHIIVSNPPYIPSGEIDSLAPEVARFDPRAALDGGPDGYDAFREIAPRLAGLLEPGGWAVFEIGDGQLETVRKILQDNDLGHAGSGAHVGHDLAGRERCIAVRRPGKPGGPGKRG